MRFLPLLAAMACTPAVAQEVSFDCDALYAELIADKPINLDSCTVEVADYTLDQCTPPSSFNSTRPTSHLILAIDASGSMAGRVGGETKMEIAKREALSFLNDIPEEVDVGLVVYGHKGTNQDDGRAESCAASELVHDFDANRRALQDSIRDLRPTGWTPLGGVLEFSQSVIADLDPPREGDLAPVVYLISDGEETCDGNPVAAAGALFDAGVQTTVNTIGFDVDPETAAQLEAIADAAGGIYYPAEDARALRAQLNAIKDAEAELNRYQLCVNMNAGRIASAYHNARIELAGCFARNDPAKRTSAVLNATNKAEREGRPEAQCKRELQTRVIDEMREYRYWLSDRSEPLVSRPLELIEAYRAEAALDVLQAAE